MFYDLQGKYEDALVRYEQALKIVKKTLGPEHPHVASTLNNMAEVYRAQVRLLVDFFSITAGRY